MTALLDVPAIRQRAARLSVEEYHRLGEGLKAELLRGFLIEKMPKSPLHLYTLEKLRAVLANQIKPGWTLRQEGPLSLRDSEPEPDLAIVQGSLADFKSTHPTSAVLVIEVAVSSLEIDRVKALIYAEAGVAEYWIVCPSERQVEVYRAPSAEGFREQFVVAAPTLLAPSSLPGVQVDLGALFS